MCPAVPTMTDFMPPVYRSNFGNLLKTGGAPFWGPRRPLVFSLLSCPDVGSGPVTLVKSEMPLVGDGFYREQLLFSRGKPCENEASIPYMPISPETAQAITPDIITEHGLTLDEYQKILKLLGRPPSLTELGIFSVMWSEHCSYKSSRIHLKRLPTRGKRVVQGPGENAGIIDVGEGWACAFKIESHNHPSYIEPYQGAATGVGGILRDIFTMNARPFAVMDSLRFGPLGPERSTLSVDRSPLETNHAVLPSTENVERTTDNDIDYARNRHTFNG